MATISISREELMEKLLAAKALADKEDAIATKKHHVEEQAALKKFRENIREALKWDYETAKSKYFRVGLEDRPSCPRRNASHIELAIRQVQMDSRKGRFHLPTTHDWYRAATWLPESQRPKESVCD